MYNLQAKEINTSGKLGDAKNGLCIEMRPDSLLMNAYTASDKHSVQKIAVWLCKITIKYLHIYNIR